MSADAVLTLNAGSSSLKLALFAGDGDRAFATGLVDRIGGAGSLRLRDASGADIAVETPEPDAFGDHAASLRTVFAALRTTFPGHEITAVGHRVVHGGPRHAAPVIVDTTVLADLAALNTLAPLHQPHNLAGIRAAMAAFSDTPQVACFDTGFHRTDDFVAEAYALPRRYHAQGVRRYGFHGLSYEWIAHELARTEPALAAGRVVVAHLGNGASMCGVHAGRSVASTMGFSPLDGLVMGTRCGQIDPGVLLYLMEAEGMDAAALSELLYRQSGLLGLSGISNDMRTLEASDASEAAEAIACFVARIRRELGGLAAALGGIDGLVFTGGIGENSARVRAAVCDGMGWMGIGIDAARNDPSDRDIGTGAVRVLVIPTNEERVIARAARMVLDRRDRGPCRTPGAARS